MWTDHKKFVAAPSSVSNNLPALPPLPAGFRPAGYTTNLYTAEQMRAYAAAAAAAERARWESAIGAVMPLDFKSWHENATAERPEVAAWCIVNARKQSDLAWMQIEVARARSETAVAVLRQIAAAPRKTREQRLASSCLALLDGAAGAGALD